MPATKTNLKLWVSLLALTLSATLSGQNQCQNIGFEYGNLDGFSILYGNTGDIIADRPLNPGTIDDQHVLQRRTDGVDLLSEMYCVENKALPVVGQGLGEYSMRLGNSAGGRRVAQIVRELTVTPENNFLILSYAVLLEDPAHDMIEQPRFVFQIRDTAGNLLSCGTYDVFAGPDIEGFENCGDWRVRPWTTAGFELQSFLGQTIRLEITAIDCDLGAHGGYAYVDLTCRPLEIVLSNYCEGESVAFLTVTEGFEKYQWNTGHTTNQIVINNPVPGTEYTVQVTSATGCTISLTDTLPQFEELPHARLEQTDDVTLCESSNFLYYPTGEHIARLELVGSGFISDSMLINTLSDRTYTFVATDDFGCNSDTMSFTVFVQQPPFVTSLDPEDITCDNSSGSVTIHTATNHNNQYTLDGITFQDSNVFEGLEVGDYFGNIVNETGCTSEFSFSIDTLFSHPKASLVEEIQPHCDLDNGSIEIYGTSGISPFSYGTDMDNFTDQRIFEDLEEGTHTFYIKDAWGCIDSISVTLVATPPVILNPVDKMAQHCDQPNGTIEVAAQSGTTPYTYSIQSTVNNDGLFDNLTAGEYAVIVTDEDGCRDTVISTVDAIPIPELELLDVIDDQCNLDNGAFSYALEGGVGPYIYELDGSTVVENSSYEKLSLGTHQLIVTDSLGCTTEMVVDIGNIPGPILEVTEEIPPHCDEDNGVIVSNYTSGTAPMTYSLNGSTPTQNNEFNRLQGGDYTLIIEDINGCRDTMDISLPAIEPPRISDITIPELNDCNDYESFISMDGTRGTAPYSISYNQESAVFESEVTIVLPPGEHKVTMTDAFGCIVDTDFILENIEYFYVPNAIVGTDPLNENDRFIISRHHQASARLAVLAIYDRWGNPIYEVVDQPLDDSAVFWDGRSNGEDCPPGTYAYRLEIADACGEIVAQQGTVTLVR